jgi:glycosyltransferase involved in cell wall biosynthesis
MKTIAYYGNKLKKSHGIETVMESLINGFSQYFHVKNATNKQSIPAKIIDFTRLFFTSNNSKVSLIDVFSTKAFWFAVYISTLCRLANRKYILVLHGGNLPMRFKSNKRIFSSMIKNAYLITAPSMYLVSFFENKKIQVKFIPNPIRIKEYPTSIADKTDKAVQLLYLRGFGKIYRPQLVIKACDILKNKGISFHLHMFGRDLDGTLQETIGLIQQLNLNQYITIHGSKTKEEWMVVAQKCYINVSVPEIDNTPVSILECMAMGIPTISTNVGGIPFMIQHKQNALLTDATPVAIAENIIELIDNEGLHKQIVTAAKDYVMQYEYSHVLNKWNEVINQC